ncbi:MAG: phosphotransferase [Nanoarchaeota archaeon]|nr:phosphotransferase [Nanoarchaeota archaeon]
MKFNKITKTDLGKIVSMYNLGKLQSYSKFDQGIINDVTKIVTDTGEYVVRAWNPNFGKREDKRFEINLLRKLHERGLMVQEPVKCGEGYLVKYKGLDLAVFHYVEGESILNLSVKQVAKTGAYTGQMHRIIEGYRPRGKRGKSTLKGFKKHVARISDWLRAEPLKDSDKFFRAVDETFKNLKWSSGLPKGVIHNDINPGNVLFKDGEVVCLIDFDCSRYEHLVNDVAVGMKCLGFYDDGIDFVKMKAFLKGYNDERRMLASEWDSLYDKIRVEALLRGMYGISASLRGDTKKGCNSKSIKNLNLLNQITKREFMRRVK